MQRRVVRVETSLAHSFVAILAQGYLKIFRSFTSQACGGEWRSTSRLLGARMRGVACWTRRSSESPLRLACMVLKGVAEELFMDFMGWAGRTGCQVRAAGLVKGGLAPGPLPGLTDSRLTSAGWVHSGGSDSVAAARNPMFVILMHRSRLRDIN